MILTSIFQLLALGQLLRIPLTDGVALFPHEILMTIYCLLSTHHMPKFANHKEFRKIINVTIIFLGALGLSLLIGFWQYSSSQNLIGLLYYLRLSLYFWFFLCLLWADQADLKRGITVFTVLTIAFSYGQYLLYPNLRNLSYLGWDPHQYRSFGLFFDTTIAGVIYLMLFFWELGKNKQNRMILAALAGLILLSYSRIAYISFLVGMGYFFSSKKSRSFLTIIIGVFVLVLLLLPRPAGESTRLERVFTVTSRIDDMKQGMKVWQKRPIFGVGYDRIAVVKKIVTDSDHSRSAYSSTLITILAASGIFGFVAFLYFLGVIFQSVDWLGKTIILTVSVASLFDNVLLENFVLAIFLVLVSLNLSHKSR